MTRRAPPSPPPADPRNIPLQIKQCLDAANYQALVATFSACEQAAEATGYARAMRDCTAALCQVQAKERGILTAEIIIAAVLFVAAAVWVALDFRALMCGV